MTTPFTHLRIHSEYSIYDGSIRLDDLIKAAAADGQGSVAVTDLNNLYGAIKFFNGAKSKGVKPIIGADLSVELLGTYSDPVKPSETDPEPVQPTNLVPNGLQTHNRLLFICKNETGYKNLLRLVSRAYMENNADGPRVKLEWLTPESTDGIICLSGDERSEIGKLAVDGRLDEALTIAQDLSSRFSKSGFFLEVQRRGSKDETAFVNGVVSLADKTGIPLVATHPIQFLNKSDYAAHEARVCVKEGLKLNDRTRPRDYTPEQHFKTTQEMEDLFSDLPEALENAKTIGLMCNTQIPLGKVFLPDFPTPNGEPLDDHFAKEARDGLKQRLLKLFPNPQERAEKEKEYWDRLETEIAVIQKMGFSGYFMIVSDFIRWGKDNDVPIGPGRGSGAGSLVAYSLKITDLDPLKYALLFERFLNPERVSMPDFDVDFCRDKRGLVIDYVKRKYGENAVSQIATFSTLKGKSAVRDAGRILDMHNSFIDSIAKLMPTKPGEEPTIQELIDREPQLQDKIASDPSTSKLFTIAKSLEDLPRGTGKHAGGVVIAPGLISDYTPVLVPEKSADMITQFDKDDVEKAGLVKFDFLGLSTLTVLDLAVKDIQKKPGMENFNLEDLPLDEPSAYEIINQNNAVGIFQLAEEGIRKVGARMTVHNIEEITALLALYRPGPLGSGMVDNYIARKHGLQEVVYPHPLLEDLLKPTFGVIVYQEQVMQIAQKLAGYSLGGADLLRRAMGKKKPEEMAKQKAVFVEGAAKNGVPEQTAIDIFNLIEKFAEYGFNKSHSAAYAYVSYHTAYLKAKFPAEFYSASMNVEKGDTDKLRGFMNDADKNNIKILPPDINASFANFSVEDGNVRYGLSALKNVGDTVTARIDQIRRENGPFLSFVDFCERMARGNKEFKKNVLESLIKSGSFDSLEPNRARLLASFPVVWDHVDKKIRKKLAKQAAAEIENGIAVGGALGGLAAAPGGPAPIKKTTRKPKVEEPYVSPVLLDEWPELSNLQIVNFEKQALGYNIGTHPFEIYKEMLGGLPSCCDYTRIPELDRYEERQLVAGVVSSVKTFNSAKGKMARVEISDGENTLQVTLWADLWNDVRSWLKADTFVSFEIRASPDRRGAEYGQSITANAARNYESTKEYLIEDLSLAITPDRVPEFKALADRFPGSIPVILFHPTQNGYVRAAIAPSKLGVNPTEEFLKEMRTAFGDNKVKLGVSTEYHPPVIEKRTYDKNKSSYPKPR